MLVRFPWCMTGLCEQQGTGSHGGNRPGDIPLEIFPKSRIAASLTRLWAAEVPNSLLDQEAKKTDHKGCIYTAKISKPGPFSDTNTFICTISQGGQPQTGSQGWCLVQAVLQINPGRWLGEGWERGNSWPRTPSDWANNLSCSHIPVPSSDPWHFLIS